MKTKKPTKAALKAARKLQHRILVNGLATIPRVMIDAGLGDIELNELADRLLGPPLK